MKITELTKGVKKGSQKRAKHPTATDDPSKYIGKWEEYDEPQGINSPVGRRVTKSSPSESVYSDKSKFKAKWTPSFLPDPKDAPGIAPYSAPREGKDGILHIIDFGVKHDMKNKAHKKDNRKKSIEINESWDHLLTEKFHPVELEGLYWFWANPNKGKIIHANNSSHTLTAVNHFGLDPTVFGYEPGEQIDLDDERILSYMINNGWVRGGYLEDTKHIILQGSDADHVFDALQAFKDSGVEIQNASLGGINDGLQLELNQNNIKQYLGEIDGTASIQGGTGVSNDLRARDRDVITLADLENTDPNSAEIDNAEAPIKQTIRKGQKLNTDTPGLKESRMDEMVRSNPMQLMNAEYELRNDEDTDTIGMAMITDGVIETLAVRNDFNKEYNGYILSRLMSAIVNDADLSNSNLSIRLEDQNDLQQKRFLERFGFRHIQDGIMKRNAGAIRPTSVPSARI